MSDSDSDTDDEPASETERDAAVLDSDDDLSTTSSAEFTPSAAVSDAMAAMESVRARARATASALPDDAFPAAAVRAPLFDADESSPIAGIVGDAGSSTPPTARRRRPVSRRRARPRPGRTTTAGVGVAVMARERRLLWGGGHGDPSARVLRPLRAGGRAPAARRAPPAVRFADSELLDARRRARAPARRARSPARALIAVGTSRARVLLFRATTACGRRGRGAQARVARREAAEPAAAPLCVLGSEADAAAYGAVMTVDIAPRPTPHARRTGKRRQPAGRGFARSNLGAVVVDLRTAGRALIRDIVVRRRGRVRVGAHCALRRRNGRVRQGAPEDDAHGARDRRALLRGARRRAHRRRPRRPRHARALLSHGLVGVRRRCRGARVPPRRRAPRAAPPRHALSPRAACRC